MEREEKVGRGEGEGVVVGNRASGFDGGDSLIGRAGGISPKGTGVVVVVVCDVVGAD
jgi:hypothetical protein